MLTALRLQNFRSFVDTGWLDIRPITVLVGSNSTGKSSLLRFFPLLKQTYEARSASPLLWNGGPRYVDFGDYSQAHCRTVSTDDPIRVGLRFAPGVPFEQVKPLHRATEEYLTHFVIASEIGHDNNRTVLQSCRIYSETNNVAYYELGEVDRHSENAVMFDPFDSLNGILPSSVSAFSMSEVPAEQRVAQLELLRAVLSIFPTMMRQLAYIGPFRALPERFYRPQELVVSQIDPRGENLAMFVRSLTVNDRRAFSVFVAEHLGMGLSLKIDGQHVSLLLRDENGQECNLIDMGFGFSQVLPVVAQCWAALRPVVARQKLTSPSLIAIEQPELHLHPAYQARLADMFVGVSQATKKLARFAVRRSASRLTTVLDPPGLLIETHSEAMLNRFGELIESGKCSADDISVLLFERNAKTGVSTVRQTSYDTDGGLKDWPVGFLSP